MAQRARRFGFLRSDVFPAPVRKWFNWAMGISVIFILIYILLNLFISTPKYEIKILNESRLKVINSIINLSVDSVPSGDTIIHSGEAAFDSARAAYIKTMVKNYIIQSYSFTDTDSTFANPEKSRRERGEEAFRSSIVQIVESYPLDLLPGVLPTIPLKTPSIFWMVGWLIYLEITFWSLFGVLASILFRGSEAISEDQFQTKKIPVHIAKFVYAPLSAIIVIFSLNAFIGDSVFLSAISYSTIVVAFILGFFSGRTIDLLNRVKDAFFPGKDREGGKVESGVLSGKVSVEGTIASPPSPKGTSIKLTNLDNTDLTYSVNSDEEGQFSIEQVLFGKYKLEAELKEPAKDRVFRKTIGAYQFNPKSVSRMLPVVLQETSLTVNDRPGAGSAYKHELSGKLILPEGIDPGPAAETVKATLTPEGGGDSIELVVKAGLGGSFEFRQEVLAGTYKLEARIMDPESRKPTHAGERPGLEIGEGTEPIALELKKV